MNQGKRIDVRVAMPEELHAEFKIACTRARKTMNQQFLELAEGFVNKTGTAQDTSSLAQELLKKLAGNIQPSEAEIIETAREMGIKAKDLATLCQHCLVRGTNGATT